MQAFFRTNYTLFDTYRQIYYPQVRKLYKYDAGKLYEIQNLFSNWN